MFNVIEEEPLATQGTGSLHRMSIEQAASMRKVKPAFKDETRKDDGFEHVSGCFRYSLMFLANLLFWTGLVPIKWDPSTKMFEFKLFSISSLFAFVRLLIITFPFLILPLIFIFGGFTKKEYEETTGQEFHLETPHPGLEQLYEAEFYLNFLIYILPFVFAFVGFKHFTKVYHLQVEFFNSLSMEHQPSLINVKHVIFPILGFLDFALGKLLNVIQIYTTMDSINFNLYINMYTNICYFLLAHLALHFLLAVYENYLYQVFNMFQVMCSQTLNTKDKSVLVKRANMLPGAMEAIQGGFGFFILVNITLMLIYWLLHLFHAYFTFQVGIACCMEQICSWVFFLNFRMAFSLLQHLL